MASGKTIKLGNFKINFSDRGIAAKKVGEEKIWRFQYPWYQSPEEKEEREQARYAARYDRYEEDYDEYEEDDGEVYGRYDALLDSAWLMWLLLLLLPPVGVWLLWRQKRYDMTTRSAISIAGVIWFIILLVLLFSSMGKNDDKTTPIITRAPVSAAPAQIQPTVEPTPVPTPVVTPVAAAQATPLAAAAATPVVTIAPTEDPAAAVEATPVPSDDNTYIFCTSGGRKYHAYATCSGMLNASKVLVSVAKEMGKKPCEVCIGEDGLTPLPVSDNNDDAEEPEDKKDEKPKAEATPKKEGTGTKGPYYATQTGVYYHKDPDCSGMKNASSITAAKAISVGKKACPTCVGSVYATTNGQYYHKTSNCSGMTGAKLVTVAAAKKRGQTACPVCMSTGGTAYYATATGKYYHVLANCSGMQNAAQVSVATAKKRGQTACPECIGDKTTTYYYATKNGKYYHNNQYCSDMAGAEQVTLTVAKSRGQAACPVCLKAASNTTQTTQTTSYYSTNGGKYYHKNATCSGMQNANQVTLATINQRGQTACPVCLGGVQSYYSTANGQYYHKTANCSGMTGADKVSYSTAKNRGQTACPVCLGGAGTTNTTTHNTNTAKHYYATVNGKYYHKTANCSGMKNATKVTQTAALANGKSACPVCIGGAAAYYSTTNGKYFHKNPNCSGMKNADIVSYTTAIRRGQSACPVCAGGKQTTTNNNTTTGNQSAAYCYATRDGKYYHTRANCSGMQNASRVTVAAAKANGQAACPVCAGGKKPTSSNNGNQSGTTANQNVSVWITSDKVYHSRQYCSGHTEAVVTTLAYARSNGYTRCTACKAP